MLYAAGANKKYVKSFVVFTSILFKLKVLVFSEKKYKISFFHCV